MTSIGQLVRDISESIRKILQEKREADAVKLSKLRFKTLLRQLEFFLKENDVSTFTKFQMLEVELDARAYCPHKMRIIF